ncbi:MAG: lipid-A-disaccharide synthase [Acidobacteriaceae bacterium]
MPTPAIFISAGEASGERYGAMLIEAVFARLPDAQFFGLGGSAMHAAGCDCLVRAEDIAVMGITEVVRHLPHIYGEYRRLIASIRARRPDVAVLIDFPDVNFRLARELKKLDVPVIYFVSPQLWAWKKHRIRWVQERVAKMLVIFPFEEKYYRDRGVDAEFVGHPLADLPQPSVAREAFAQMYGLEPAKPWVGLLPGSRRKELRLNLPTMAAAAAQIGDRCEYLLPVAPTLSAAWVRNAVAQCASGAPIHVVEDARAVLFHARANVVASGTATVEAALIGNPFVAVYRISALSYAVASRMVQLPHVAMANLIAGKRVVPELIQDAFTAENVVASLLPLLAEGPPRSRMLEDLLDVRHALHVPNKSYAAAPSPTSIDKVAACVVQFAAASLAKTPGQQFSA